MAVTIQKKSENSYNVNTKEYSVGKIVLEFFAPYCNEESFTGQEIVQGVSFQENYTKSRRKTIYKDIIAMIRGRISAFNCAYRTLQPNSHIITCLSGCCETRPHRICHSPNRPARYWMRKDMHIQIYGPSIPLIRPLVLSDSVETIKSNNSTKTKLDNSTCIENITKTSPTQLENEPKIVYEKVTMKDIGLFANDNSEFALFKFDELLNMNMNMNSVYSSYNSVW